MINCEYHINNFQNIILANSKLSCPTVDNQGFSIYLVYISMTLQNQVPELSRDKGIPSFGLCQLYCDAFGSGCYVELGKTGKLCSHQAWVYKAFLSVRCRFTLTDFSLGTNPRRATSGLTFPDFDKPLIVHVQGR